MSVAESPGMQVVGGGITRAKAASRMLNPFFSSTFSDFTEEREHLTQAVFPQFIKMCEEQTCMFSPIDLRWGITSEQLQDGQVINICLNTVETSRPFFITCLGERYGWQRGSPKGEEGHDEVYQKQLDRAKASFPWIADYEDRAVTELEIMQAFLHDFESGQEVDTSHMHVYLRRPKPEHARDMRDGQVDENCRQKLAELKERLRNSPVTPIEYDTPEELGEYVLDDLIAMLRGLVAVQKKITEDSCAGAQWYQLDNELEHHTFFGAKMTQFAVACEPYINAVSDHFGYQAGERAFKLGTPMLVSGATGAGKSTIAAATAEWAREQLEQVAEGRPVLVMIHHVGCTVQSKSHVAFVRRALSALKTTFGIEKDIPKEDEQLVSSFREWMEIAADRGYTLLVLDGVDQFNDSGNAHEMTWLPDPPYQNDQWSSKMAVVSNFQVLVTATVGSTQQSALLRRKWRSVGLHHLLESAKIEMSRKFMAARAKTLTEEQLATIASADQTNEPLFLRAVLEELVVFGKFEELDKRIEELLSCPSVVDVYTYKIDRLRQAVDVDQAREILSFMWVSRAGVAAEDLQSLIGIKGTDFERMQTALDGFLRTRTGLLDFVDPKLREAVQVVFLDHRSKIKEFRKRLARYLEECYEPDEDRYSEVAWQYSQSSDDSKLLSCITNPAAFSLFRSERHREDFMLYCRTVGKSTSGGSDYALVLEKLSDRLGINALVEKVQAGLDEVDPNTEQMAATTYLVAKFAVEVAQFKVAENLLVACIAVDQMISGSISAKLARDQLLLAQLYVRNRHPPSDGKKGFVEGRALLEAAQQILTNDEVSLSSDRGDEDSALGGVYHLLGLLDMFEWFARKDAEQLDSAIMNAERAMVVWDQSQDFVNKAETLNLVGSLAQFKGMATADHKLLQKAETSLKESLRIRESLLSRSDPALGQVLNSLGDFYSKQGNLTDAEEFYHRARKVYVEGLGAKHVRGVYPLIGLANLEAQRPEDQKDYDMMLRLAEQVLSIRKQLGEDAPVYKQSVELVDKFKQERFKKTAAAARIARLWKTLTKDKIKTSSSPAEGDTDPGDSDAMKSAAKDRSGASGSDSSAGAGATPALPEGVPAESQQPAPQFQMPASTPQPYMHPPPMYYPPPAPPPAPAPPQEMLEFISSMTARIAALEARSDAFTERLLATHQEHHQAALTNATAAENAKLPAPPLEISGAQLEDLQERLHAMHSTGLLNNACYLELEDRIADFIQLRASAGGTADNAVASVSWVPHELYIASDQMSQLVELSAGMSRDQSFARQLIRKFCATPQPNAQPEFGAGPADMGVVGMPTHPPSVTSYWQTPDARKPDATVQLDVGNGGDTVPHTSVVATTTVDEWLDLYELSEYADGLKDAGYNSMRFLKAAVKEDLEEMANDIGMKKVHTKVFFSAWDELLQLQAQEMSKGGL